MALKDKFCVDCGKPLGLKAWHFGTERCIQCAAKKRRIDGSQKYQTRGIHHHWGGDKIKSVSGNARARRWYKMSACKICSSPGRDRHHADQNTLNNNPDNIIILCRSCHKKIHLAPKKTLNCVICGNQQGPFRKKRCEKCDSYFRYHQKERPINLSDSEIRKARALSVVESMLPELLKAVEDLKK